VPDASAVPNDLFYYADHTSTAADDLHTLVRNRLVPAIDAYRRGAGDFGAGIFTVDRRRVGPIEHLLYLLTDVHDADQAVHAIGEAFMKADQHPFPNSAPGTNPEQYKLITVDEAALAPYLPSGDAIEKSIVDGQALGRRLNDRSGDGDRGQTLDAYTLAQLKLHKDDPYYLAAFFNAIYRSRSSWPGGRMAFDRSAYDPVHGDPELSAYLVTALGSGQLSPGAISVITLAGNGQFLKLLAANPRASFVYLSHLTDDELAVVVEEEVVDSTVTGGFPLLRVAAAAMQGTTDQQALDQLYARVAKAYQDTAPSSHKILEVNLNAMIPDMAAFLAAYERATLPPPPAGGDPSLFDKWAHEQGEWMAGLFTKWRDYILSVDGANASAQTNAAAFALGVAFTVGALFLPAEAGVAITVGVVSSAATSYGLSAAQSAFHWPQTMDADQERRAGKAAAQLIVVASLASQGRIAIRGSHGPDGKPVLLDPQNQRQLLDAVVNPDGYQIVGSDLPLRAVEDSTAASF
jgi:hypothetical protein